VNYNDNVRDNERLSVFILPVFETFQSEPRIYTITSFWAAPDARSLAGIACSNPTEGHGCPLVSVLCCHVEVSASI
jgi:hypothetical protein